MEKINYIQIKVKEYQVKKESLLKRIIIKLINKIIPIGNPDYEEIIDKATYWLLEFEDETIPIREIGIDNEGKAILKMPYKNNYGYWTDNELEYKDFLYYFCNNKIDKAYFEKKWNELN